MYELQGGILCLSCPQKDESIRRLTSELAAAQAERDRLQAMVPRLEWAVGTDESVDLVLLIGKLRDCLIGLNDYCDSSWRVYLMADDGCGPGEDVRDVGTRAAGIAFIIEWCAVNLPNYRLPDFPGTL